jgi:hypothetical protein
MGQTGCAEVYHGWMDREVPAVMLLRCVLHKQIIAYEAAGSSKFHSAEAAAGVATEIGISGTVGSAYLVYVTASIWQRPYRSSLISSVAPGFIGCDNIAVYRFLSGCSCSTGLARRSLVHHPFPVE